MKLKFITLMWLVGVSSPVLASIVYIPPNLKVSTAKMVVVIHGCLQSAESMELGTGWNQVAEVNNPHDFQGSILVIQGNKDAVVNPQHGPRVILDFVGNTNAVSTTEIKERENSYSVSDYESPNAAKGRLVLVNELGHAWSGFAKNLRHPTLLGPRGKIPTVIPFFSEAGPSATDLMWEFFQEASCKPRCAQASRLQYSRDADLSKSLSPTPSKLKKWLESDKNRRGHEFFVDACSAGRNEFVPC